MATYRNVTGTPLGLPVRGGTDSISIHSYSDVLLKDEDVVGNEVLRTYIAKRQVIKVNEPKAKHEPKTTVEAPRLMPPAPPQPIIPAASPMTKRARASQQSSSEGGNQG